MLAQLMHNLLDLIPNVHPNDRAALHERISEHQAAEAVKASMPPEEPPPAPVPVAAVPEPPQAPPAAV